MTHFQVWNKSVHFRIRIFSGPLSQNSVWHLGHIGDFYGYPDPDPDAASLVLCSVGKLLGWSWRGKRLASFENRVNQFLPGWKTVSSRHLVGVCRLASTQGDQFCVLSDQQACIQSTQTRVTSFGEMTQDRLTDVYQGMNGTISYIIKNIVKMPWLTK